ncbi:hypothetical protein C6A85_10260, partial [Mycobacterium sp. ITM-2017-0098]
MFGEGEGLLLGRRRQHQGESVVAAEITRAHSGAPGPAVVFICIDGYAAIQQEFGDRAGDALMR